MSLGRSLIAIGGFAFACATFGAEEQLGPAGVTSSELEQFARNLQAAVATQQPMAVADLVSFPLRVNEHHKKSKYLTKAQFTASFPAVFTPHVVAAVTSQDPKDLFQNSNGAMFGDGEVWLASVCANKSCTSSKLLVVAINLSAK